MNAETMKKPWMIVLIVLAAIGLVALGYFGSRTLLGNQIKDEGFPRAPLGAAPASGGGDRAGGEVLAVSDTLMSIKAADGEVLEFNINAETEILVDGGFEALDEGGFALVQYESADDGSLIALSIGSQPEGGEGRAGGPAGGAGGGGRGEGGGQGQK